MFRPLHHVCILFHPLICLMPSYHLNVTINLHKMIPLALIKMIQTRQQMFMCEEPGQPVTMIYTHVPTFSACSTLKSLYCSRFTFNI